MNRHKNAPAEQAQKLSKNSKIGTVEKDFEDILTVTSKYYSEALERLACGEANDREGLPELDDEASPPFTASPVPDNIDCSTRFSTRESASVK